MITVLILAQLVLPLGAIASDVLFLRTVLEFSRLEVLEGQIDISHAYG
jgi:hypothetical protein